MLSCQRNNLLFLLSQFRMELFKERSKRFIDWPAIENKLFDKGIEIIDRNLTSIEKQIKKL